MLIKRTVSGPINLNYSSEMVYIPTKHTHIPHTYKNKWTTYVKYGELWTVLTTFSSLGDFRHLLLREPWRKMFHFNNWHYDLQFKRKKNKLRRVQTLTKAFGQTVSHLFNKLSLCLINVPLRGKETSNPIKFQICLKFEIQKFLDYLNQKDNVFSREIYK